MTQSKSESPTMTMTEPIQVPDTRPIPPALVAALLFQVAGIVFWAGNAAERIAVLERDSAQDRSAIEHIAVLESELAAVHGQLVHIEAQVDRLREKHAP